MAKKKLSKKHSKNFIKKKNRSTKRRQRKVIKKGGTVQVLKRDDIESFKIILDVFNKCFTDKNIYIWIDDELQYDKNDKPIIKNNDTGKNIDYFKCIKQEIETKIKENKSNLSLNNDFNAYNFYELLFEKYEKYSIIDPESLFEYEQININIKTFFKNNKNITIKNEIFNYLYKYKNEQAKDYNSFLDLFANKELFLYNFLNELIGIINDSQVEEPIQQVEITE